MSQRSRSSRRSRTPAQDASGETEAEAVEDRATRSPLGKNTAQQNQLIFQNLNDRLANLTTAYRAREAENVELRSRITTIVSSKQDEINHVQSNADEEINLLRRAVNTASNSQAQMTIERDTIRAELDKLLKDNSTLDKKASSLERAKTTAESGLRLLQSDYSKLKSNNDDMLQENQSQAARIEQLKKQISTDSNTQRELDALRADNRALTDDLTNAIASNKTLEDQILKLRKDLDKETSRRVATENDLVTATDEAAYQKLQLEERLTSLRSEGLLIDQTTIDSARVPPVLQSFINDQLEQLRDQLEDLEMERRVSLEKEYGDRESTMKRQLEDLRRQKIGVELTNNDLKIRSNNAEMELCKLRRDMDTADDKWEKKLDDKNVYIARLEERNEELLAENNGLTDLKVRFDTEIAVYDTLLGAEEQRCGLSPSASPQQPRSSKRQRRTLDRGAASSSSIVRRTTFTHPKLVNDGTFKGDLKIISQDVSGQSIVIQNISTEDVKLSGFALTREIVGDATQKKITFKFTKNQVIKASSKLTIWSNSTGKTTELPYHVVMKSNQNWPKGEHSKAVLLKGDDEEASLVSKREYRVASDELDTRGVKRDESCSIM